MRRLPTWLIVAAVGALVALAAADAIRPHGEPPAAPTTAAAASAGPHGLLVYAGPGCEPVAVRLPRSLAENTPRMPDCGGFIWSGDGTLAAACEDGRTTIFGRPGMLRLAGLRGCSPAWRPDGALSVIRDGDLVVARRRGPVFLQLEREEVAEWLAGKLEDGGTYTLVAVAWQGSSSFFGILAGRRPWQRAILIYTPQGLADVIPELGGRISNLRVSPSGDFIAFVRRGDGQELVMMTALGEEVPLPRIPDARALAWSPDERWVALATPTTTFVARTGSRAVTLRIPLGGTSLLWLP